jgi:DNA-binding transcriptional LysR family regulator
MVLTDAGLSLLEHARTMGAAVQELMLSASGQSQAVEGLVSVSASDAVATWLLPPVLRRLREVAPGITVEVVTSNALSDLRRREADIAIRHVRPDQPDLIGRLLYESSAGFYASADWVARHGHPRTAQDAQGLDFIGADRTGRYWNTWCSTGCRCRRRSFGCCQKTRSRPGCWCSRAWASA